MAGQLPMISHERLHDERPEAAALLAQVLKNLEGQPGVLTVADHLGWLPAGWLLKWGQGLFENATSRGRADRRKCAANPKTVMARLDAKEPAATAFALHMASEVMARLNFVRAGCQVYHFTPNLVDRLSATSLDVPSEALVVPHHSCLLMIGTEHLADRMQSVGGSGGLLAPLIEGPPIEIHVAQLSGKGTRRVVFHAQQQAGKTVWGWTLDLNPGKSVGDAVEAIVRPDRMMGVFAEDATWRLAHLAANALLCLRTDTRNTVTRQPSGSAAGAAAGRLRSECHFHEVGAGLSSLLDLGHSSGLQPASPGGYRVLKPVQDRIEADLVRFDPLPAAAAA